SGTITVGATNSAVLLSGTKTLYLSASGNVILGGSSTHDIIIGVKAASGASNATWNTTLWAAGLRVDSTSISSFSGAVTGTGQSNVIWARRIRELAASAGIATEDFTGSNQYTVNADGTGSVELTAIGLGTGGKLLVGVGAGDDPEGYE